MVCQQCDTGQRYCAQECRRHARKDALKRAQIKYQNSRKGRLNNAQRQRRFRQRQKISPEIVTHQTSPSRPTSDLLRAKRATPKIPRHKPKIPGDNVCHFCGGRCGPLFRVGFLKKRTFYPYRSKATTGETVDDH